MATQYIGRRLSGGVMALCVILLFTPLTHSQGVVHVVKYTISGNAGAPGVLMQGLVNDDGSKVMSDDSGQYTAMVRYGWGGNVKPTKEGYTFNPSAKSYSGVNEDKTGEDYEATIATFTISGTTGQPGVILRGLDNEPNSGPDGRYSVQVTYGQFVSIMPYKEGYLFDPDSKTIESVKKSETVNFTARVQTFTIAGNVGRAGVTMKGLPNDPKSDANGDYRAEVQYGWSGTVTPEKEGHEFLPEQRDYPSVMDAYLNEDYTATVHTFQISGSVGMAGVLMEGLPNQPMSDDTGFYTDTVEYGWNGTVTPTKLGYSFSPTMRKYEPVKENYENQDYNGSIQRFKIQGTVGVQGATIRGFPEELTSGPGGMYSATVDYGFYGVITVEKEGYEFDPPSLTIDMVSKDLARQDFKATRITYTISGNVRAPGVQMRGLPGSVISGADGSYSATNIPYKASLSVTPVKEGYTFEPDKMTYEDLTESRLAEDYMALPRQYVVSGKITSTTGEPLQDVLIMVPEKPGSDVITGPDGQFNLTVDYRWTGKLTPVREDCTFTPPIRSVQPVTHDLSNLDFRAKMKTVTITDKVELPFGEGQPPEPIAGVTITAEPSGATAITDSQGKYTITLPWGWSGDLIMSKEGLVFDPDRIIYGDRVTENLNALAPKPTPAPVEPGPVTGPVGGTTPAPVDANTAATAAPGIPAAQQGLSPLEQEKARLQQRLDEINKMGPDLTTVPPGTPLPTSPALGTTQAEGPLVTGQFGGDVFDVLKTLSRNYQVNIATDATIKPATIQLTTLTNVPMSSALEQILVGTGYESRKSRTAENTYEVFRPVTVMADGTDLTQALQDLSTTAGVPIVCDDTIAVRIYADIQDPVPVEEALEMLLRGTQFVAKREGDYYFVADRRVESGPFPYLSETHRVWLNYINPSRATLFLSKSLQPYAQTDLDPNSHVVAVTAPPDIAERIVSELKAMDVRPKQVLLDARIVTMERGDLLNIGVKWGMPTAQYGFHGSSYLRGTQPEGVQVPDSSWPWALSVGLSFDQTFTNALMAALNLLQENSQADIIANPKVVGQDGRMSRISVMTEERFAMTPQLGGTNVTGLFGYQTEFQTITSGTSLEITPRIGDNNDITLELAVEVSDSVPRGRDTDLPVVTRRTAQNAVTIRDGGTVAVAGLTENRNREKKSRVPFLSDIPGLGALFRNNDSDKATREIAVFVTARLIPDTTVAAGQMPPVPDAAQLMSDEDAFRQELRDNLSR